MLAKGISYLGIFFLNALSLLPLRILHVFSALFYLLIYHVFGYRKNVVRENLVNSFPEKSAKEIKAIEQKFFKYLISLIFEVIKMNNISEKELKRRVKFKNVDLVEAYLQNNESVIFCSSHYGNYEWVCMAIGLTFSGNHYPIYKPLSSKAFDNWFLKMRSKYGTTMVAMKQTIRMIQATKNQATMFTFGSDQAPTRKDTKYWTTLLNQQTSIQLGVEKIAKKTDRPVFYLKTRYVKRGFYEVDCVPICLDPKNTVEYEITELHTRFLEDMIKEEPAYWLWSHRRWKRKPEDFIIKNPEKEDLSEAML
ncbi:lysophospholipid acyltransferase family protein [Pedobacter namyangjuensis]|uniref:lysophospholipid acyltransferase family protein n=1 Tax=Pedobacter namyangjuensis TaxID=600626 RepID=UPI000DE34580|nr:lysophospholipid acyltransferase family protein [Pedobacter namyangjuensis]